MKFTPNCSFTIPLLGEKFNINFSSPKNLNGWYIGITLSACPQTLYLLNSRRIEMKLRHYVLFCIMENRWFYFKSNTITMCSLRRGCPCNFCSQHFIFVLFVNWSIIWWCRFLYVLCFLYYWCCVIVLFFCKFWRWCFFFKHFCLSVFTDRWVYSMYKCFTNLTFMSN